MRICVLLALPFLIPALSMAQGTAAGDAPEPDPRGAPKLRLKNHEPIFVGNTHDSDDKGYLDFTLSLQHPIFANTLHEGRRFNLLPYFAVTARLGQYIGTRESSPVIAKRFNPKLFVRYAFTPFPESGESPDGYLDLEYAHESNGQSVDNLAAFQSVVQTTGNEEYARDYISRGWDYLGFTWKRTLRFRPETLRLYVKRRWYCGCLLQVNVEELHPFEAPRDIQSIRQVSGWRAIATFDTGNENALVDRFTFTLDTGTRDTFKYITSRVELGIPAVKNVTGVPLVIWARSGYLSDLAQYHKKVDSYGVAFELWTLSH